MLGFFNNFSLRALIVLAMVSLSRASVVSAEDEFNQLFNEFDIVGEWDQYEVLDSSEARLIEEYLAILEASPDPTVFKGQPPCSTKPGKENKCGSFHPKDKCTQRERGPKCRTDETTCEINQVPVTFKKNYCCDFGASGSESCGCNKEIRSPGKCDEPRNCLKCLLLDEIGMDPVEEACVACVKKQMDDAIAESSRITDYCELATSFFGAFAYSGPGQCICNSQGRDGRNAKYCKCCKGERGDWTYATEQGIDQGMNASCPVSPNQFRAKGSPPPQKWVGDPNGNGRPDPNELQPCTRLPVPGCTKVDFYRC